MELDKAIQNNSFLFILVVFTFVIHAAKVIKSENFQEVYEKIKMFFGFEVCLAIVIRCFLSFKNIIYDAIMMKDKPKDKWKSIITLGTIHKLRKQIFGLFLTPLPPI